jgi:manganese/iron transport system permease protein
LSADASTWAPLAGAILIALPCGAVGAYVVLRRMAFIGDALSHTVLPGLVVAALCGWSLSLGALAAGQVTAVGSGWLARRRGLREDTAIGVLFTAMFALGVALSSTRYDAEELHHLLFGDLLRLQPSDLPLLAAVALAVVGALALAHKELELASCDPTYAEVIGIPTDRLRYLLLGLIALTTVAGLRAAGVLLTTALLVTPAAAAALLTRRLVRVQALASALAVAASLGGIVAARATGIAAGAAIVLAATAFFALAWLWRGLRA